MYDAQRIKTATEVAMDAFWAKLAEQFPEITTGDLDPGAVVDFENASVTAATLWIHANRPQVDGVDRDPTIWQRP
jgi:hypothetical protein